MLTVEKIRAAAQAIDGPNVRAVAWVLGVSADELLRAMARLGVPLSEVQ